MRQRICEHCSTVLWVKDETPPPFVCAPCSHMPPLDLSEVVAYLIRLAQVPQSYPPTSDPNVPNLQGPRIAFDYTNYKGVTEARLACGPFTFYYGTSPHHETPQWLFRAWDLNRNSWRTYAAKDMRP